MILADKIIRLRKKSGWSQEELAERMNVSRQAVSKWESAQTAPDLGRILQLSELFGVTTDYLIKDEIEDEEFISVESESPVKRITLAEANEFLEWRKKASVRIATATFLCIVSVIPLLLFGAATESPIINMNENFAAIGGLALLLLIMSIPIAIFIHCGFKNSKYDFIDKQPFETEYGVKGLAKERQEAYRSTYMKFNIIATCLCVVSPIPLFIGAFTENVLLIVAFLCVTLLIAGVGVVLFIIAGVRWASTQKLLKEGEYSMDKKKSKVLEAISSIYWLAATAIYLGVSFTTNAWEYTWIVWPIAAIVFVGVRIVCRLVVEKGE